MYTHILYYSFPYNNLLSFLNNQSKKTKKRPKHQIRLYQNNSQNDLIVLRNGLTISQISLAISQNDIFVFFTGKSLSFFFLAEIFTLVTNLSFIVKINHYKSRNSRILQTSCNKSYLSH